MSRAVRLVGLFAAAQMGSVAQLAAAQSGADALLNGFQTPPDSARPRVWWHWMNGNITQKGIEADLDWMHRIGLGGAQTFDAAYNTPQVVDQRLVFMTPPWKEAFRFAAMRADHLGLELAIAGSPGWSESGGPWVKPEDGMKKLVWSETWVEGEVPFAGKLPQPPSIAGPFQNVPAVRGHSYAAPVPGEPVPNLYRDVAVVAYRLPAGEISMVQLHPAVTSSAGPVNSSLLWDGDFTRAIHLPHPGHGQPAWIQVDFGQPRTIQSMSVGLIQDLRTVLGPQYVGAMLESSSDGKTFHRIAGAYDSADDTPQGETPRQETVTFGPVTARYFRLVLPTPPDLQAPPNITALLGPSSTQSDVTEFVLHSKPRVERFERKAGYFLDAGVDSHPTRRVDARDVIRPDDVIDLTGKFRADGTLAWTLPPGRWAILRVGYSLLGITNHPASPEGTGLEVDKLSRSAVKAYMDHYLARYESLLGPQWIGQHGLRAMVNDSWEAGPQNWSDELPAEFARRRGYDLHRWLPALTGRIIDSAEATDRFLWDFRRTLGDLLVESHYGQIAASLRARGMVHYGEAHERQRAFIGDGMDAKRDDDIPMAAMWTSVAGFFISQEHGDADIRESASVAHIYGQNLVAAESMTSFGLPGYAYAYTPENLKPTVDRELADGLNLFVIHTSAHQPKDNLLPGLTLGHFGQWFTRHETWAEQAAPWVSYLARSSYLLQQGHFVADVVYYYGQDSNITALYGKHLPPIPEGYAFDFASAHALSMLSVKDGDLVTVSGMRYRLLVLDPRSSVMSLDVLKRIASLVREGATVLGGKPQRTPSLVDDEQEFRSLAGAVWGTKDQAEHAYGKGRVVNRSTIDAPTLAQALDRLKVSRDFSYVKPEPDTSVWYVHRHLLGGDLYFVNNRADHSEQIDAYFRVKGKAPEVWHADTGLREPASYRIEGVDTVVPLALVAHDAIFVVFREPTTLPERHVAAPARHTLASLRGPWNVSFQPNRGAPDHATFSSLVSWSTNADPGIRYFSGTAEYATSLEVSAAWVANGQRVELDLGEVKNIAEVLVNGRSAGIVWKSPFRLDITDLVRSGHNDLRCRVTNLWPNRLIGDKQPGAHKVTFSSFDPYKADSPLLPSGLLGPVTVSETTQ